MRRKGASVFIYLIFGILIAIFVVTLGAPGQGEGSGCGTQSNEVVDVDGNGANLSAYRIAYSNGFNRLRSREKVYFALETLIRREILADAAAEQGLRVTGDMVDDEIKKGYFFQGGLRIPLGANIFDEHEDGTRTWNVRKFKNWVASLDVKSTSTYRDEQVRSMQAALMYELLTQSTRVSREEALSDFIYTKNTVSYDVVTFAAAPYRAALRLTDADIERYLTSHEADVKARYTQDERLYKGLKPQLKLRQIFIAKAEPPKAPDKAPEPAPGSGSGSAAGSAAGSGAPPKAPKEEPKKVEPPKVVGLPIEEAKAKLEAARTAITANKQKFADAAKQLATDESAKANGGDLGWRSIENPQLGDKAVNDAVKALKPGEMTPVITTDTGAFLVMAEDKREGDLAYDKVKHEIAGELARDVYAKEAAKRAALASIEEARKDTGKNLSDMFEKEPDPSGGMPNMDFLNDPNMSEDEKRMILEQLKMQMQQQQQKSGQIMTWESKDIPVKWDSHVEKDPPAGSGSAKPAAGSGSATMPAAGSGSGSATGSGTTPPPAEAPPPGIATAIPPVEATKDQLPQFATVEKPKIVHFSSESRKSTLPGLAKEMTPVIFDELSAGMLAKRVYEVEGNYVLVQVTNKTQAKVEDFEKEADRYVSRLQLVRSYSAVEDWIEERCKALHKDKKIVPMKELVSESDEKTGKPAPQVYQPCMYANQWLTVMLPALGYGGG
ncbi:MAG: peptidylprolyl isomerase [Myxococcota bacterium]|nr:peptidylprolyl isomerase [Myxococcota bacterium]